MNFEELLRGSARIDQMKREINAVIKMVFGFISEDEIRALSGEGALYHSLYQTDYTKLILSHDPREGLRVKLYILHGEEEALIGVVPGNEIALMDVQSMHGHLDVFVRGMEELFPSLGGNLAPLYRAADMRNGIFYRLRFHVPSDDPHDTEEGKLVEYQKKSRLNFPLPLGTELWFGIEGEPTVFYESTSGSREFGRNGDEICCFKVVGYGHGLHDQDAYLEEQEFFVILEVDDDNGGVDNPANFVRLLEANEWVNRY